VPQLAGLSPKAVTGLLNRITDAGILTLYGDGSYGIHPALPWYFAAAFRAVYGASGDPPAERPVRAYTRVMALLGHAHNAVDLLRHYQGGSPPPADRTCRCERVPSAHPYAEVSISIRNQHGGDIRG
jgi:hypothetical protein